MEFDFPLLPLLPTPITLVPASTFAELERQAAFGQSGSAVCSAFTSKVTIGSPSSTSSSSTPLSSSLTTSSSSSYLGSSYGSATTTGTSGGAGGGPAASPPSVLSDLEKLGQIVDALGEASAKAQDLPSSITQRLRLAKNPSQRIYIVRSGASSEEATRSQYDDDDYDHRPQGQQQKKRTEDDGSEEGNSDAGLYDDDSSEMVTGMLKMGEKKLFVVDRFGVMHEQEACCVLDFYVNEACQRQGYGKQLFDYMLKTEDIAPEQIAYDRPSPKLYQFLRKHFGLEHYVPQPSQFAIFEGFLLADTGETLQAATSGTTIGRRSSPSIASNQSTTAVSDKMSFNTPLSKSASYSSSLAFNNGSSTPSAQRPLSICQQQPQQPSSQPNRRISSAFTSSIQLGDVSDKNPASAAQQQPSRRISSAYTSSIDLSHPSALSALP